MARHRRNGPQRLHVNRQIRPLNIGNVLKFMCSFTRSYALEGFHHGGRGYSTSVLHTDGGRRKGAVSAGFVLGVDKRFRCIGQ